MQAARWRRGSRGTFFSCKIVRHGTGSNSTNHKVMVCPIVPNPLKEVFVFTGSGVQTPNMLQTIMVFVLSIIYLEFSRNLLVNRYYYSHTHAQTASRKPTSGKRLALQAIFRKIFVVALITCPVEAYHAVLSNSGFRSNSGMHSNSRSACQLSLKSRNVLNFRLQGRRFSCARDTRTFGKVPRSPQDFPDPALMTPETRAVYEVSG